MPRLHGTVAHRLPQRFVVNPDSGCWEWVGALSANGYGLLPVKGVDRPAHRLSWELHRGLIPDGLHIDHLCRNRKCVNPDHLEPVTPGENVLRGIGRSAVNARKEQCDHGHPFDAENTRVNTDGSRSCRACDRDRAERRRVPLADMAPDEQERRRARQRLAQARYEQRLKENPEMYARRRENDRERKRRKALQIAADIAATHEGARQ